MVDICDTTAILETHLASVSDSERGVGSGARSWGREEATRESDGGTSGTRVGRAEYGGV